MRMQRGQNLLVTNNYLDGMLLYSIKLSSGTVCVLDSPFRFVVMLRWRFTEKPYVCSVQYFRQLFYFLTIILFILIKHVRTNCNQLQFSGYLENGKILLVGKRYFPFCCPIMAFDIVPTSSELKNFSDQAEIFRTHSEFKQKIKILILRLFFSPRTVKFLLIYTKNLQQFYSKWIMLK
jgi:hypothetical protein